MDLTIINKGFGYAQNRKKWILLTAALGFSTYGAYRVCNSPSVIKKRDRVMKVLGALASITELLGDSAETIGVVSKDMKEFIQSDSDQIPNSLRQLFKITKSDEFSESIVRVTRALTMGIVRGYRVEAIKGDSGPSFSNRALDKLFSPASSGFVSVVVGSFTRNLVMAMYADKDVTRKNSGQNWVDVISDDKCRKLIGECIQQFVSTMVTVYLDKTMDTNPFEEILSSLTSPKHEEKIRDLLVLVCNNAVETFIKTSHQVLTNPNSKSNSNPISNSTSSYLLRKSSSTISKVLDGGQELVLSKIKSRKIHGKTFASNVSSSSAIPDNVKFVLDVTGRVTLATIKSFFGFSFNRLSEGMKRNFQEVYWYLTEKSLVVTTVCISMFLHMFSGPWSLVQVLA